MEQFEKSFLEKLGSLNGTQVSIQTLSAWLIQNKATVKHVGKLWYKEMKKVHRKRKLTLLYLMNDVVQNSRKQGPEFLRVFSAVLIHAIKDCAKAADAKVLASLDRLVRIWQDRHVFEPDLLKRCRELLVKIAKHRGAAGGGPRQVATSLLKTSAAAATSTTAAIAGSLSGGGIATAAAATGIDDDDYNEEADDSDEDASGGPDSPSPALRDAGVGSDDDNDEDDDDDVTTTSDGNGKSRSNGVGTGSGGLGAGAASALRAELAKRAAAAADQQQQEQPAVDTDAVLAELQFLAAAPSGSAEMRRRISRFPKHIVEEAAVDACRSRRDCQRLQREVAQADEVCAAYNRQLAGEVDRRRGFHASLRAYCRAQQAASAAGRARLEAQRGRLRELRALRQELAAHMANLPDLAALPAVTAGLAPLPSVGDLFS